LDLLRETDLRAGVLVDSDGTLLDTNYLHALAWSRALRELGEWAPMNAIHRLVGMGGDQLVAELLGHEVDGARDAHAHYYGDLKDDVRPFSDADLLLHRLHDAGLVVVLASSASEKDLSHMRAVLDADDAIDAVVNADDVERSKPDPQIFEVARAKGCIDPSRALTVGDSIWDVRASRAAGFGCVAVESGGTSRNELAEEGAVAVYKDAEELAKQLRTSPIALLVAHWDEPESKC
jgi:HAD superfamily hydrolase (TIGR01509 family)